MRVNERSYLSTLARDTDRQSPAHDMMVSFFAEPENLKVLLNATFGVKNVWMFDTPQMSYALGPHGRGNPYGERRVPVAYLDLLVKNVIGDGQRIGHLVIEVKALVKSIPNLMQQINAYRALTDGGIDTVFMLVTPCLFGRGIVSPENIETGRLMRKQLEDQGVKVFEILMIADLWAKLRESVGIVEAKGSIPEFLRLR